MTAVGQRDSGPASYVQPTTHFLLAAWFGLLTGFGEVLLLLVKRLALHQIILLSQHVIWLAPLADALLFAAPGLVLFLLAWRWPALASVRTAIWVYAFLGFLSLALMYALIQWYAAMVLAAGLATVTSRILGRHSRVFVALVQRTTIWLVVLTISLAAGTLAVNP